MKTSEAIKHTVTRCLWTGLLTLLILWGLTSATGCTSHNLDFRDGDPVYEQPNDFHPQDGPPEESP